mgnify:CR=1 FL=1
MNAPRSSTTTPGGNGYTDRLGDINVGTSFAAPIVAGIGALTVAVVTRQHEVAGVPAGLPALVYRAVACLELSGRLPSHVGEPLDGLAQVVDELVDQLVAQALDVHRAARGETQGAQTAFTTSRPRLGATRAIQRERSVRFAHPQAEAAHERLVAQRAAGGVLERQEGDAVDHAGRSSSCRPVQLLASARLPMRRRKTAQRSASESVVAANACGSARSGVMSLKTMPGLGKSGTSRTIDASSTAIQSAACLRSCSTSHWRSSSFWFAGS